MSTFTEQFFKVERILTAEYKDYTASYYIDKFNGKKIGNISIYNNQGKELLHATVKITKFTEEDLVEYIKNYLELQKIV